jgi:hypothetical protein
MAFAQLTGRESLRDIETCLRSIGSKLYHAGLRGKISRSTLADANKLRDYRIYEDFAQVLITRARTLYAGETFGIDLEQSAYALDSSTIDLCLSLFFWARFRKHKGAIKLHMLMVLKGSIPCVIRISNGKTHDVAFLDHIAFEPGVFYIMDKAYIDFQRLYHLSISSAYFVTRAKKNMTYARKEYRKVDKSTGLRSDHTITLTGYKTSQLYPAPLRRISYADQDTQKRFVFLTNNFQQDALTIAMLYKCRWQIELYFKWIKQHLRIKAFYGTSPNAVKTQIWIAISTYLLVAIVKKRLHLDQSLYTILQILSVSLFEKTPISQAFHDWECSLENIENRNQLMLFN